MSCWIGNNRTGETGRKSNGGIGILYDSILTPQTTVKSEDWLAVSIHMENVRWFFITVYIRNAQKDENTRVFDKISSFIETNCTQYDCIFIAGDFNAHIDQLSGKTDTRGILLNEFVHQHQLTIVNLSDKRPIKVGLREVKLRLIIFYVTNTRTKK